MIHYCLITYLTCVNAKCILKLPKDDGFIVALAVNAIPYKSKKECLKANSYKIGTFGGVKQSITCYGRELKPQEDCVGQMVSTTNYKTSIDMGFKKEESK